MNQEKERRNVTNYRTAILFSLLLIVAMTSMFTMADLDTDPVIIQNASTYTLDSSVIIYWDTSILADSLVKYGLSSDNLSENNYLGVHSYAHAAELIGLLPETTYYYRINSTSANGHSNETEVFSFTTLEDNVSPSYSNISSTSASGIEYSPNTSYYFRTAWTDNGILSNVTITHNFRGNVTQETMQRISGTDIYEYVINNSNTLPAGNYFWSTTGEDLAGNSRDSNLMNFTVNKSSSSINLTLNGEKNNIELEQRSFLNVSGLLERGDSGLQLIIRNSTANSTAIVNQTTGLNSTQIYHYFENVGNYTVLLNYNETQNYTGNSVNFTVNVTPIEVNLFTDKAEYNLGDAVSYVVLAPNNSNLTVEVCGPLPTGSGFVECKTMVSAQQSNYPYMNFTSITNKTGTYRIRATIQYKGLTKYTDKNYTVVNSLQVLISGNTIIKIGKESSLTASASGGVGNIRYNWTLSNGTKISGQNLNVKYNTAGSYPVIITATDDYGNLKTNTTTLVFKKYYTLKVLVLDSSDNSKIESARVKIGSDSESTDENGLAEFEMIEDDYSIKVSASGYVSVADTIESDANKTITVKLEKSTASSNDPLEISLVSPLSGAVAGDSALNFEAYIDLGGNSDATCWFYISEDNNDWYRAMKTIAVKSSGKISYSEAFTDSRVYSWKVQCDANSKTYSSSVWKFTGPGTTNQEINFTIIDDSGSSVVDAGEIRRRIDSAMTNLDSLDMESKKDADAFQFETKINLALRNYERAMRDINNIGYRRDLSVAEQDAKKKEYYEVLKDVEKTTPVDVKNLGYKTFISYPSKEEIINISKMYQQQKNVIGKLNEDSLIALQNSIIITTRASNVEVTYLDGRKQVITLVAKTMQIKDNSSDTFLLERIPKEFAQSSKEITFTAQPKVIIDDPLMRFEKGDSLVYFVDGEKNLDVAMDADTILISDKLFGSRSGNIITGDVTFSSMVSDVDFSSPVSLIILIVIIGAAYLLYAFDVFGSMFEKAKKKSDIAKINKIRMLISDAKEFVQKGNIERADLLFKEIKLLYESSSIDVMSEVYSEAINLLEIIDSAQVECLITTANNYENNVESKKISEEEYVKIAKMRADLKEAHSLLSGVLKEKYGNLLGDKLREMETREMEAKKNISAGGQA